MSTNSTRMWQITSGAGVDIGTYPGATKEDALDAMARDAGYADHAAACEASGDDGSHLHVVSVNVEAAS